MTAGRESSALMRHAADLLERLPDLVEAETQFRDLTPREVAEQAGVPVTTLLNMVVEGTPPSHKASIALLRWLAGDPRE